MHWVLQMALDPHPGPDNPCAGLQPFLDLDDEAMAALKEKGIEFQSEEYDPLLYPNGERNAIFRGPDDERLQIEQIL